MSVKKSSRGAVSKTSSATWPAVSASTQATQKSSILTSAFAPSRLQLSLFASVIQGFDSQYLRIHDTSTGRLRCDHTAGPGTRITSLDWGYYGTTYRNQQEQNSKKKRKRNIDNSGSAVVAFGTSRSEICMFSPSEAKIVGKLSVSHERGVKDFRFYGEDYSGGWSIGGDGKLVQWDLRKEQAIRSISLPDPAIGIIAPYSHGSAIATSAFPTVICASATPYIISITSSTDNRIDTFDSLRSPVHAILLSGSSTAEVDETFLAADADRYINLYGVDSKKLVRTLNASGSVESMSLCTLKAEKENPSTQLLAVTTHDGVVDLFTAPFQQPSEQPNANGTIKSKRKSLTRKANASIKLIKPDTKGTMVQIFQASVQGPDVVIASAEGGVDVSFQKVRWQDEGTGELLFDGVKEVARSKSASSLKSAAMNGVKDVGSVHVDESKVVVGDAGAAGNSQVAAIEISSEDEDEEANISDADENDSENDNAAEDADAQITDAEMADADAVHLAEQGQSKYEVDAEEEGDADAEPTFGELLAAKNPGTISIADALVPAGSSALVGTAPGKGLSLPSGVSLSTVLTQSLRTNDQNLLESCFHATDLDTIRLTVQRLDSSLAGNLLQKLAERLSSRPGRYGHLLVWVQWTCIAHGGAIAGRPDVSSKIKTLYNVLSQRSKSLDNLLLLKGKLDMLEAQLTLRRQLKANRGRARDPGDADDVIYIEGQDNDDFSSDEDEAADGRHATVKSKPAKKSLQDLVKEDAESDDDEEMPLTNGVLHSDEDDSAVESDEEVTERDNGGLIDDEADESGEDSHPSDREVESEEEEEDSTDADSELDSFINDGSVEYDSASDVDIDDTPENPPTKKKRRA